MDLQSMDLDNRGCVTHNAVFDSMPISVPNSAAVRAASFLTIKRDPVLVFLLIALSGNPLAVYSTEWMYAGYIVVLIIYLCIHDKLVLTNYVLKWLIGIVALFAAQYVFVRTVSFPADVNFIAKFLIAYITVWLCGESFCKIYTDVIYVICLISLIFYGLSCIHIQIPGFRFDRYITIGIWNYLPRVPERNCGMFWEPGAFQGFIMLPFLFYIGKLKWFWQNRKKQVIVLGLALLSTMSTTAYVVAALYAMLMLMASKLKTAYKLILVGIAFIGTVGAFLSLDFLGSKIGDELATTERTGTEEVNWSRTGAMFIEIANIARHPITGNGFLLESRYLGLGDLMAGAGNGFTGMINMLGIPMALAYLIGVAHSWRNTRRAYRRIVVIILIALLFGEYFLNYPLFWSLLFVKLPYPPLRKKENPAIGKKF